MSKRHIYFYIFTVIIYFSKHENSVNNKKVKAGNSSKTESSGGFYC